jgi:hypothetical protein
LIDYKNSFIYKQIVFSHKYVYLNYKNTLFKKSLTIK